MPNRTFIPAFKAHVGSWHYFICLMKYAEVARQVQFAYDLGGNKDLSTMIQRGISARTREIEEYLIHSDHRFLGSLIVAAWGGDPQYTPVTIQDPDDLLKGIDSEFGLLTFDGTQQYFALDGQHRLRAIKDALKRDPALGSEEICVLMVAHYDTDEGRLRTRRLFTNINRNAKSTTSAENIALDEDYAINILTRQFLMDHSFLRQEGVVKVFTKLDDESGDIRLAGNVVPKTDPRAFTTITVLNDMLKQLSFDCAPEIQDETQRPTDEVLEEAYRDLSGKLDELLDCCGEVKRKMTAAGSAREVRAPKGAEERGHAFTRTVVQRAVAATLRHVVHPGAGGRVTWKQATERLSGLDWEIGKAPWTAVFNTKNKKMQTGREFTDLLRALLRAHIAPSSKQEIRIARKVYKELRGHAYPVSEDELVKRLEQPGAGSLNA